MNIPSISAVMLNLVPCAEEAYWPADTVLHGQLNLAGCMCHVEAIQVNRNVQGILTAVNSNYNDEVEAMYNLCDNSLTTAEINGKDYLLVVLPHSA